MGMGDSSAAPAAPERPNFSYEKVVEELQSDGWVRFDSVNDRLIQYCREWGLNADHGPREEDDVEPLPVKEPLRCFQRRRKPVRCFQRRRKPAPAVEESIVDAYEESDYEEPDVFSDCYHTREEHEELERTMGPTIKEWRARGQAAWGNSRIFFPRFEQFVPPPDYLEGLSPREKELLEELTVFARLFSSDEALLGICDTWFKDQGCCKYMVNCNLHRCVMYSALRFIYDEGKNGLEDLSYRANCYLGW